MILPPGPSFVEHVHDKKLDSAVEKLVKQADKKKDWRREAPFTASSHCVRLRLPDRAVALR
jgi:hypothetical protein